MASQNDVLEALRTKEAATSTEDLAKELKASREGTRKQLTRLKDKGYVDGDSQEGWLITEDGRNQLERGGVAPSMVEEGVTPRDVFEGIGRRIGITPDRIVLATDIVWSGDYTDIKWVWEALRQAVIRDDLAKLWVNSWRAHLKKGIPPELERELVGAEEEQGVKAGAKPRVEEGRSYILVEDLPVYVGKNLGDLLYEDAVDLARIRAGRAARGAVQGAPSQPWGARDIIEIVNAVRDWAPGQAPSKSYMVTQGEGGAIVQEVEPGKPMVLQQPASKPGATYLVKPDGSVKQMEPGEPIVVTQQAPAAQRTFIVKQTPEGATVEEHDLSKPIIINALAPASGMPPMYPFPAMGGDGKPILGSDGKPVYVDIEPMLKWVGFQGEQRRADERHNALMGLTQVIKENLPIGIEAFSRAVGEVKGKAPESTAQQYECGSCHTKFTLPREPGEDEKVICPKCGTEWTGKVVMSA